MCTLSWVSGQGGYSLFFNRDEGRTRGSEAEATHREAEGVEFIAPLDTDQGGTWLATNEYGITIGLLNRYGIPFRARADLISRGRLVLMLTSSGSVAEARRRMLGTDLTVFQPFTAAAAEPAGPLLLLGWDGRALQERAVEQAGIAATSSALTTQADRARRHVLETLAAGAPVTPELLEALHRSHLPERGPLSPCMHRDDAETRSFCRVTVGPDGIEFRHVVGPPCLGHDPVTVTLPRRVRSSPLPG
jgi:transport and Golgi organization protein 2